MVKNFVVVIETPRYSRIDDSSMGVWRETYGFSSSKEAENFVKSLDLSPEDLVRIEDHTIIPAVLESENFDVF